MPKEKYTVKEFAEKIRNKYNAYHDVDDEKLVRSVLKKYPVYSDKITFDTPDQGYDFGSTLDAQEKQPESVPGPYDPESEPPPQQKQSYEDWINSIPEDRRSDKDYDLKKAYEDLPEEDLKAFAEEKGHLPDTYKKQNHITFSNESVYSNEETPGGEWSTDEFGRDTFKPTMQNLNNAGGAEKFKDYFDEYEKGVAIDWSGVKDELPKDVYEKIENSSIDNKPESSLVMKPDNSFKVLSEDEKNKYTQEAEKKREAARRQQKTRRQQLLNPIMRTSPVPDPPEAVYAKTHTEDGKKVYDELVGIVGNKGYEYFTSQQNKDEIKSILMEKYKNFNEREIDAIINEFTVANQDASIYNRGIEKYTRQSYDDFKELNDNKAKIGEKPV